MGGKNNNERDKVISDFKETIESFGKLIEEKDPFKKFKRELGTIYTLREDITAKSDSPATIKFFEEVHNNAINTALREERRQDLRPEIIESQPSIFDSLEYTIHSFSKKLRTTYDFFKELTPQPKQLIRIGAIVSGLVLLPPINSHHDTNAKVNTPTTTQYQTSASIKKINPIQARKDYNKFIPPRLDEIRNYAITETEKIYNHVESLEKEIEQSKDPDSIEDLKIKLAEAKNKFEIRGGPTKKIKSLEKRLPKDPNKKEPKKGYASKLIYASNRLKQDKNIVSLINKTNPYEEPSNNPFGKSMFPFAIGFLDTRRKKKSVLNTNKGIEACFEDNPYKESLTYSFNGTMMPFSEGLDIDGITQDKKTNSPRKTYTSRVTDTFDNYGAHTPMIIDKLKYNQAKSILLGKNGNRLWKNRIKSIQDILPELDEGTKQGIYELITSNRSYKNYLNEGIKEFVEVRDYLLS